MKTLSTVVVAGVAVILGTAGAVRAEDDPLLGIHICTEMGYAGTYALLDWSDGKPFGARREEYGSALRSVIEAGAIGTLLPIPRGDLSDDVYAVAPFAGFPEPAALTAVGGPQGTFAPFRECIWQSSKVSVRFLDGDPAVQDRVMEAAAEWSKYAHIKFVSSGDSDADVRISFQADPGSWSWIGRCARYQVPDTKPTMNLGWISSSTDDVELRRVVLHEFGHALGLGHEHQHPLQQIHWNDRVYDYYWRTQGWTREEVERNVLRHYDPSMAKFTPEPDLQSIMEYPIPAEVISEGEPVGMNLKISATDQMFVRLLYP